MLKKINLLNIVVSFFTLIIYMYFFLKNGNSLVNTYDVKLFYCGALFAIVFIMFSLFKKIRNNVYMDVIFMLYIIFFIVFNLLGERLKTKNIYVLFLNYPFWLKYVLGVLFLINFCCFIKSLKKQL